MKKEEQDKIWSRVPKGGPIPRRICRLTVGRKKNSNSNSIVVWVFVAARTCLLRHCLSNDGGDTHSDGMDIYGVRFWDEFWSNVIHIKIHNDRFKEPEVYPGGRGIDRTVIAQAYYNIFFFKIRRKNSMRMAGVSAETKTKKKSKQTWSKLIYILDISVSNRNQLIRSQFRLTN
jgi:hypothetical protein